MGYGKCGSPVGPPRADQTSRLTWRDYTARAATDGVIDDACAFAWQQFLLEQPDRERAWRGWLVTTAEREVWRPCRAEETRVRVAR
jgi:hypothetical protein